MVHTFVTTVFCGTRPVGSDMCRVSTREGLPCGRRDAWRHSCCVCRYCHLQFLFWGAGWVHCCAHAVWWYGTIPLSLVFCVVLIALGLVVLMALNKSLMKKRAAEKEAAAAAVLPSNQDALNQVEDMTGIDIDGDGTVGGDYSKHSDNNSSKTGPDGVAAP